MATHAHSSRQNNHNEDEPQSIIQVSFLKSCCPPDLNISNTDHCVQREPLSFSNLLSTSAQSGDLQSSESSQSIQLSQIQTPIPSRRPCQRPSDRPASYHISTPPPKRRFNAFPRIRRKRTFIADEQEMPPPPSKRPRVSIHKSSKSPSLSSIDENSTTMSPEPTLNSTNGQPGDGHIEHNGSLPMSSRSSISMSPIAKLADSNAKITGNSSGNSMKCAPETMSQPLSPTNSENKQNEICSMNSKTDQIDQINKFNKSKPVKCTKSNTTKCTKTTKSKKSSKLKVHNAPLRRSARIRKKQQIESQSSTVSSPSVPTLPDYSSIETHRRNHTSSSSSTSNSSTTSNSFSFSIPSISTIHSISSRSSDWNDSVESSESAECRQCTPTNSNSNSTSTSKSPLFGSMGKSLTASSTDRDDDMSSLSKPLSALNLQGDGDISMDQNELNQNDENVPNHSANNANNEVTQCSQSNKEWTDILSESVTSKWNAAATPIRSSLKKPKRPQQRRRRISWGQIECRNFEQRCGILSGGVPNSHGPSLHLGKLLTERTHEIDEWESTSTAKGVRELKVKERKQRVALFSPKDLERKKLKMDREEISRLTKSRENIGCDCLSIYKMKKDQIIERILYIKGSDTNSTVDIDAEKKRLKKLKKNEVLEILMKMQFAKYGRYDVCCVDESCECFRHGIECQIDSDCCDCGGDTVYNNFIVENWKLGKPESSKKDSLSCGNPNGNTLKVVVTDHKGESERGEHDVLKVAEDGFVKFKSPAVQKSIIDWNQHYEMNEDDSVCGVLNFD